MYKILIELWMERRIKEDELDKAIKFKWITEEQKKEIMGM
ncbi:XkdX family protein [Clostridium hydrogeniformans]|nr:XkdX family protein [Clostridium hydrogeniformans]